MTGKDRKGECLLFLGYDRLVCYFAFRRHNQELPHVEVKCGWVRNKRGVSVVDENEIEQEGSNENHNTVGNDESSETMNDLYNKEDDCNIGKIKNKVRENRIQTKVKNDLEPRSDSSVKQEPDKEILASRPH